MASPVLSTPWVPLWPLTPSVLGELAHAEATAPLSAVTATTEATAVTFITLPAITVDGATPILLDFYTPHSVPPGAPGATIFYVLYDGATNLGSMGQHSNPAANAYGVPLRLSRKLTPAAGSHTYSVRVYVSSGTGQVYGGLGAAGGLAPANFRVTLASPVVPAAPPPGTWQDYTPVLTCYGGANPALGSLGATRGRYCQVGKLVTVQGEINMEGTGINPSSGNYRISLPVPTISTSGAGGYRPAGDVEIWGTGTEYVQGTVYPADTTTFAITYPGGTLGPSKGVDNANPWVPVSPYRIFFHLTYEAA